MNATINLEKPNMSFGVYINILVKYKTMKFVLDGFDLEIYDNDKLYNKFHVKLISLTQINEIELTFQLKHCDSKIWYVKAFNKNDFYLFITLLNESKKQYETFWKDFYYTVKKIPFFNLVLDQFNN